jgi:polyphenol oxidase
MNIPQSLVFAFSNKNHGNMSFKWGEKETVIENRKKFLAECGLKLEDCIVPQLEHGDVISVFSNDDRGKGSVEGAAGPLTETMVTKDSGLILFMVTADCFPVGFYDTQKNIIALAHLGWKPIDKMLAFKTATYLKENFGSDPKDIHVFIGPGIRKKAYTFPINDALQKDYPHWQKYVTPMEDKLHIDLVAFINDQLTDAGIPKENIQDCLIDTGDDENYFSHRRAKERKEVEGRFATLIKLK